MSDPTKDCDPPFDLDRAFRVTATGVSGDAITDSGGRPVFAFYAAGPHAHISDLYAECSMVANIEGAAMIVAAFLEAARAAGVEAAVMAGVDRGRAALREPR